MKVRERDRERKEEGEKRKKNIEKRERGGQSEYFTGRQKV
jgi:hypothetical protein